MALQIVPGSEVQTPVGGAPMDANAFRNAALAPAKIAQSLGDNVAGVLGDIALKVQQNRNARTVFDADLTMRKTYDDFTASLHKNPDETTWLPQWKDKVQEVQDQVMNGPNVGPEVKRQLEKNFAVWDAARTAEVRTAALVKGAQKTREAAIADATYAAHQGDLEGAQNSLRVAVDHFAMTKEEAAKISQRFPTIAAQAQADTIIATDPIGAPDKVKQYEKVMEPRVFIGVMAHANAARNRAQADNVNDLAMQIDASPDGTIEPDLIRQKVKSGDITQRGADGLLARMAKEKMASVKEDYNVGMMQAHDHNWAEDKTPEDTARQLVDEYSHLPEPQRMRLYKYIDSQVKDAKTKADKAEQPVAKAIFDQMREDRENNGFTLPVAEQQVPAKSHWFSPDEPATTKRVMMTGGLSALRNPDKVSDQQIESMFGKGVTREQLIRAEQAHYANIQGKMRQWFADPANKGATYEQANAYRIELEKPFVFSAVTHALKPNTAATESPEGKRIGGFTIRKVQ